MKAINTLLLVLVIILQSCNKEDDTPTINNEFHVSSLICYPNDSISVTFLITSSGGKAPYTYFWINPDTLNGNGPFKLPIDKDLDLQLEVTDANNVKVNFQYGIKKDTIDILKYDYRNPIIGLYKCEVIYHGIVNDTSGNWTTETKI